MCTIFVKSLIPELFLLLVKHSMCKKYGISLVQNDHLKIYKACLGEYF